MSAKTEDIVMEAAESHAHRDDSDEEEEIAESVLNEYMTDDYRIAPEIIEGLRSNIRNAHLQAATKLRQLADHRESIAIQSIFDSDLLHTIIEMMCPDDAELQVQVIRILAVMTTYGSSEQVSAIAEAGAIPKLIGLASSTNSDYIRDNVFIAMGDIGAVSHHLSTKLIQEGGLKPPLDVLADPSTYAKSNLYYAANAINCYIHPGEGNAPEYEVTQQMILVLSKYVLYQQDETDGSLQPSLLGLSNILVDEASVGVARETDLIPRLVQLCTSQETETRHNAHLCVSQIIFFSVDGAEDLINAGILGVFKTCMASSDGQDRKDACFATSNLVVDTFRHAKALKESGLVPPLVKILSNQGDDSGARNHAAWTLSSLATNCGQGKYEILDTLLEGGALEAFCSALTLEDYDSVEVLLDGILVLVKTPREGRQRAIDRIKAGDGIERLRVVRFRNDIYRTKLHKMAQKILTNYFPEFKHYRARRLRRANKARTRNNIKSAREINATLTSAEEEFNSKIEVIKRTSRQAALKDEACLELDGFWRDGFHEIWAAEDAVSEAKRNYEEPEEVRRAESAVPKLATKN
ncbi:hypothetical protein M407DRAFT_22022 [Tulasnella calospora MUT 4182]|uniref:Importin subunit alpha n=1 Tax=Tulasnella calospora MUT 4182 TaxID=1051891 RepID=A0A0C3QM04_9AGAM|nr:hypothetical protein M407DRAFT_22022 [Tulasnella calospora MUT 4182]